jgi:ribosome-associated translation inhibitor RaiA
MKAEGTGKDAYLAFGTMLEHLEKQLRRYNRRLKSHH